MIRLFPLVILTFCFQIFAQSKPEILPSLEWQKSVVKKNIESKLEGVLATMLTKNEYYMNVTIELVTPEMPDFYAINPKNKPVEKPKTLRPSVVAEQDPYGYVVFQKMGLEAPLLEDFKDQITPVVESKPNIFENIWKYNNAVDVYKNIDHVSISLKVTESILPEARERLEKLVREINFDLPNQSPSFTFEYMNFKLSRVLPKVKPPVKIEDPQWKKVVNVLERFQLPLGLILAVTLLGAFGFLLLKKYQQILQDVGPNSQTITMENNSKSDDESSNGGKANAADAPVAVSQSVLERFVNYLENAPRECVSLIRVWIRESNESQVLALSYLVEELPNEKLTNLVSHLAEDERVKLRTVVSNSLKTSEINKAKDYIGSQVRDEILKGEKIDDPELQNMLLALSPQKAAELITLHPETISYLFSKLTAQFLGLILDHLPEEKKKSVLSEALVSSSSSDSQYLKTILPKFTDIELFSPTLEKLKQIIPEAGPSTEGTIYEAIARHGNSHSVRLCALRNFPSQLIPLLPTEVLKEAMLQFDSQKRIEYLETLSNEEKDFYLDAFAPEGSKARDIYELDYERICEDASRLTFISANSELISKNFVSHMRSFLRKNTSHQGKVDAIITNWSNDLASKYAVKREFKVVG